MGLKFNWHKLRGLPLHWRLLYGGQVFFTLVVMGWRVNVVNENKSDPPVAKTGPVTLQDCIDRLEDDGPSSPR